MTIDWTKSIEAVHEDGRVLPATKFREDDLPRSRQIGFFTGGLVNRREFREDGSALSAELGWRIRNVPEHPTPTQYAPELVASMEAFVRRCARGFYLVGVNEDGVSAYEVVRDAKSILSDLPQEVDPDDQAASELVTKLSREGFIFGNTGQAESVAMAGIKLGRQLQRGEAA